MPSQEYWNDRYENLASKYYRKADKTLPQLKSMFKNASGSMQAQIASFYAKYGIKSSSPVFTVLDDGTKLITGYSNKLNVPLNVAQKYNRIASLESQLNAILEDLAKNQGAYMTSNLSTIASNSYYEGMFEMFKGYGMGYNFALLDPQLVAQLVMNPVNGIDFIERIGINNRKLANNVNQILRQGLIEGISNGEMSKRLSERANIDYGIAKRLMQTEVTNAYGQATLQRYEDTGIVNQYEYLATLDDRTSQICGALDGKRFDVAKAVVGLNYPPMHPNCRSTTIAYFPDQQQYERSARDKGGKIYYVPASTTYTQWAKEYL